MVCKQIKVLLLLVLPAIRELLTNRDVIQQINGHRLERLMMCSSAVDKSQIGGSYHAQPQWSEFKYNG